MVNNVFVCKYLLIYFYYFIIIYFNLDKLNDLIWVRHDIKITKIKNSIGCAMCIVMPVVHPL